MRDVRTGIAIVMAVCLILWGAVLLMFHALQCGQYEVVIVVLCGCVWIALAVGNRKKK